MTDTEQFHNDCPEASCADDPSMKTDTQISALMVAVQQAKHLWPLRQAHLLLQASLVDLLPSCEVGLAEGLVDVRVIVRIPFYQVYSVQDSIQGVAPGGEHALHAPAPLRGPNLPGVPRTYSHYPVCAADACLRQPH